MKKGSVLLIVVAVVAVLGIWGVKTYNQLVGLDEAVSSSWSQVENVYQRRSDLIPNLVATVKGYAAHEESTLEGVVEARSKATQVNISDLSEESIRNFQQAQGQLSSALSRLMAVVENYPDLKANENFLDLQAQLEGTENRIAEARRAFNETAKTYNVAVRTFPANIIAGICSFPVKGYFTADEGASKAPVVQF
ncbi:MAG: LemA family protein [Bacteroidales bacterium]|nr:LemA family protein [Candidatus Cryptobacteroides equifaecalis]